MHAFSLFIVFLFNSIFEFYACLNRLCNLCFFVVLLLLSGIGNERGVDDGGDSLVQSHKEIN